MNFEAVIAKIKEISNDLCNNSLEPFRQSLEEITTTSTSLSQQHFGNMKRGYLKNLYDNIHPSLQVKVNNAQKVTDTHLEVLQKKYSEIKHLKQTLLDKRIEYDEKKKKLVKMKSSCKMYEQKLQGLQNLRDCIKTYKLLTRTHFAFKKGSTSGYIRAKDSTNFEVFDYSHSQVSEEDITKKIWLLLEKISKDDHKNRKEEPRRNNKKIILS